MQGGSLDYAWTKVNAIINDVKERARTPLERAFIKHLRMVSDALYELERSLSGDTDAHDADKAIRRIVSKTDELDTARERAEVALEELSEVIAYSQSVDV